MPLLNIYNLSPTSFSTIDSLLIQRLGGTRGRLLLVRTRFVANSWFWVTAWLPSFPWLPVLIHQTSGCEILNSRCSLQKLRMGFVNKWCTPINPYDWRLSHYKQPQLWSLWSLRKFYWDCQVFVSGANLFSKKWWAGHQDGKSRNTLVFWFLDHDLKTAVVDLVVHLPAD